MSSRVAISTVIGGILMVAIIFTTFVPLLFFVFQANQNYERAISERRLFEEQRASEKLLATAYQDFADKGKIKVFVRNTGSIPLTILRTWVVNRSLPGNPYVVVTDLFLNTFQPGTIIDTGIIPLVNRVYDVFLVTERGNVIVPSGSPIIGQPVPPTPIDVIKFPFALTVTLKNMQKGVTYNLTLVGNIPGGKFTLIHKATASNTDVTLAFGVYPGDYTLIVSGTKGGKLLVLKTITFSVPDVLSVVVDVSVPAIAEVVISIQSPDKVCPRELFTVVATITNTGLLDILNLNIRLTISSQQGDWDVRGRDEYRVSVLGVDGSVTVSWSVRASKRDGSEAILTVLVSGSTELATPVSASNSTSVIVDRTQCS